MTSNQATRADGDWFHEGFVAESPPFQPTEDMMAQTKNVVTRIVDAAAGMVVSPSQAVAAAASSDRGSDDGGGDSVGGGGNDGTESASEFKALEGQSSPETGTPSVTKTPAQELTQFQERLFQVNSLDNIEGLSEDENEEEKDITKPAARDSGDAARDATDDEGARSGGYNKSNKEEGDVKYVETKVGRWAGVRESTKKKRAASEAARARKQLEASVPDGSDPSDDGSSSGGGGGSSDDEEEDEPYEEKSGPPPRRGAKSRRRRSWDEILRLICLRWKQDSKKSAKFSTTTGAP